MTIEQQLKQILEAYDALERENERLKEDIGKCQDAIGGEERREAQEVE